MVKKLLCIGAFLILYCIVCYNIYEKNIKVESKKITSPSTPTIIRKEEQIGFLKIDKIKLYEPLYEKNSTHNNVEENITILEESILPEKENSIIFLAAHSGTGDIAYFENLDKLKIGDEIKLEYNNTMYIYEIIDIWEEDKNGYIHVNKKEENQLILTTCSPTTENKQLVINSILKNTST